MSEIAQISPRERIQWQPIIEMVIVLMTILGSTIPLFLSSDSKISAIQQEMKDFHTKLALQDLEFKTRLTSIEEKRTHNQQGK